MPELGDLPVFEPPPAECDAELSGLALNADLVDDFCPYTSPADMLAEASPESTPYIEYVPGSKYYRVNDAALALDTTDPWNGKQWLKSTGDNPIDMAAPKSVRDFWLRTRTRDIWAGTEFCYNNSQSGTGISSNNDLDGLVYFGQFADTSFTGRTLVPAGSYAPGEWWDVIYHGVLGAPNAVSAGYTTLTVTMYARKADGSTGWFTATETHHTQDDQGADDYDWQLFWFGGNNEGWGSVEWVDGGAHADPFGVGA